MLNTLAGDSDVNIDKELNRLQQKPEKQIKLLRQPDALATGTNRPPSRTAAMHGLCQRTDRGLCSFVR